MNDVLVCFCGTPLFMCRRKPELNHELREYDFIIPVYSTQTQCCQTCDTYIYSQCILYQLLLHLIQTLCILEIYISNAMYDFSIILDNKCDRKEFLPHRESNSQAWHRLPCTQNRMLYNYTKFLSLKHLCSSMHSS